LKKRSIVEILTFKIKIYILLNFFLFTNKIPYKLTSLKSCTHEQVVLLYHFFINLFSQFKMFFKINSDNKGSLTNFFFIFN